MHLFDVYPLLNIEPVSASGCTVIDAQGVVYLDLYGGHAVISIGHCHPHYVARMERQLRKIGFYSNSVQNSLQRELAHKLGVLSGYPDYALFLCNSGAEANENAFKLAAYKTGKSKVLSFSKAFHGRTAGAVACTDKPSIRSPFSLGSDSVTFVPLNDIGAVEAALATQSYAAVIIEGIQGVAGIITPEDKFMQELRLLCTRTGTPLILDEIQSGYGRTGAFFAHQLAGIQADLITVAKGMGNGFPVGGVLISPDFVPVHGQLGATFGGNHLACTAALAVLEVIEQESLMENAKIIGNYLFEQLSFMPHAVSGLRGRGLMMGFEALPEYATLKHDLLYKERCFTGASGSNTIRLLPPMCLTMAEAKQFITSVHKIINE
ncbi:MAG: aminotransferase class III-fold pyridoxal phosphate-dependent enzyme [Bacteroidales bacterium]|nr:aminotransferase class III-fold pyridoxal phosphate-dependent enzyme [Bacteroidales bacterium]